MRVDRVLIVIYAAKRVSGRVHNVNKSQKNFTYVFSVHILLCMMNLHRILTHLATDVTYIVFYTEFSFD